MMRSSYIKHKRVSFNTGKDSMTRQEFADEADINNLMRRYEKTGLLPQRPVEPQYLDLADAPDLQSAMNTFIEAERAFMSLPARVRKEFDNDAVAFVEYASDPENIGQLRDWGLAPPPAPPTPPMDVRVVLDPDSPRAAPTPLPSGPAAPTQ